MTSMIPKTFKSAASAFMSRFRFRFTCMCFAQDSKLVEDWGEKHSGKRSPKVFILDLETKTIRKVAGQKQTSSYGQPHWTPEGGVLMVCVPDLLALPTCT
jgi:hypothetical protein